MGKLTTLWVNSPYFHLDGLFDPGALPGGGLVGLATSSQHRSGSHGLLTDSFTLILFRLRKHGVEGDLNRGSSLLPLAGSGRRQLGYTILGHDPG